MLQPCYRYTVHAPVPVTHALTCTTPGLCHSSCQRSESRFQPLARPGESWWTPAQLWCLPFSHRLWWRSATFYSQTLSYPWGDWACRRGESKEVFGRFSAEMPRHCSVSHPEAKRRTVISERVFWLHRPGRAGSWASDHLTFAWWFRLGIVHSSTDKRVKGIISRWMFLWAGERREEVEWRGARMPSLHGHEQCMVF